MWQLQLLEPNATRAVLLDAVLADCRGEAEAAVKFSHALQCADFAEPTTLRQAFEMAMDYYVRHGSRQQADDLFDRAYRANACTIEVCEAYRQVAGQWVGEAGWYSLLIEADYRKGLLEIADRRGTSKEPYQRYVRNVQVLALDRDDALTRVLELLRKMGETNPAITEFVSEEPMRGVYLGPYEIESEVSVYAANWPEEG